MKVKKDEVFIMIRRIIEIVKKNATAAGSALLPVTRAPSAWLMERQLF